MRIFMLLYTLLFTFLLQPYSWSQRTHHFNQDVEKYAYNLFQKSNLFQYDTVYYLADNTTCTFVIHNDSDADVLIERVRISDGSIFLRSYPINKTVVKGGSFEMVISTTERIGPINRVAEIYCKKDTIRSIEIISIKGYIRDVRKEVQYYFPDEKFIVDPDPSEYQMKDTLIGFEQVKYENGDSKHSFLLFDQPQWLNLGNLKNYPYNYSLEIVNNGKQKIYLDSVTGMNKQVLFLLRNGTQWEYVTTKNALVLPGASFLVTSILVDQSKPNSIQTEVRIFFHAKNQEPQSTYIPIRGLFNSNIKLSKVITTKEKPIISSSGGSNTRPEGIGRFGEGNITQYVPEQRTYTFTLDEERYYPSYGFPEPKRTQEIFSWETLTDAHRKEPFIFEFTNKTKETLYLLNLSNSDQHIRYQLLGKSIIAPDSATQIQVTLESARAGHHYTTLAIEFRHLGTVVKYNLLQWGYQPELSAKGSSFNTVKSDSIYVYVLDAQTKPSNAFQVTVKQSHKSTVLFPSERAGEYFYALPRSNDTLLLEVSDKKFGLLHKSLIYPSVKSSNLYVAIDKFKMVKHTYSRHPVLYETLSGVYFYDWNHTYSSEDADAFLKSLGYSLGTTCRHYLKVPTSTDVVSLQKKLLASKYKIVLFPITHHASINEMGWGGACEYYTNSFRVVFRKGTSEERAKAIMTSVGIKECNIYTRDTDEVNCLFTLPSIVDEKYMPLLDSIYAIDEVIYLEHQRDGVAGLD